MIELKPGIQEVIRHQDQFYILSTSALADDRTCVLKQDETFGLFDRHGDIHPIRSGDQGLYYNGTRHLSRLELRIGELRPLLLSSRVVDGNRFHAVDLTNPDMLANGQVAVPRGTIHIFRSKFLTANGCHEKLRLSNFSVSDVDLSINIRVAADFADIFEVRGMKRAKRGESSVSVDKENVLLRYRGLDGRTRTTRVAATPPPSRLEDNVMTFAIRLAPKEEASIHLGIACAEGDTDAEQRPYDEALAVVQTVRETIRAGACAIRTSNEDFNGWLNHSSADLQTMMTRTEHGLYPFAGVPWFSTVFGRDGIITALEYLWVNPDLARGVLDFLAAHQATETIAYQDAEPGKILHEMRRGEMANLKEIPFGLYYGSVDSTPLFIHLAAAYFRRTGDLTHARALWPAVERALAWIDKFGDLDGDGFIEYDRKSADGLVNQGWKDSNDSVFHDDGRLAEGPIALCEVQAYVYDARVGAAELAAALGDNERAAALLRQAEEIKAHFEKEFWCESLSTYALALDGKKWPCRVRTSNAGHALFSGIATPERAATLAHTLFTDDSFSGWGVRTVSSKEKLYNPMSYHNGSIWPHDNAMVAAGLARYGFTNEAVKITGGLFDAGAFMDTQRLPELFCGFRRRAAEGPTQYPVACSPQAWASGSIFLLLQSCLGLEIDAANRQVIFRRPALPAAIDWVEIKNLRVGAGSIDLMLERHAMDAGARILRRNGPIDVVVKM